MVSNHNAAPVMVPVNPMTSAYALEHESVRFQRADELTSRETARRASYIDDDGRFGEFDRVAVFRNRLTSFDQVLDIQVNSLT
jgi:hypothetical protein